MADRNARKLTDSGTRFIVIGVPLVIVGVVVALLLHGTARGIGAAIAVFGAIPCAIGIALVLSAALEDRSGRGKPYA